MARKKYCIRSRKEKRKTEIRGTARLFERHERKKVNFRRNIYIQWFVRTRVDFDLREREESKREIKRGWEGGRRSKIYFERKNLSSKIRLTSSFKTRQSPLFNSTKFALRPLLHFSCINIRITICKFFGMVDHIFIYTGKGTRVIINKNFIKTTRWSIITKKKKNEKKGKKEKRKRGGTNVKRCRKNKNRIATAHRRD